MNKIKVYQTNNRNYVFMDYDFASKHDFNINDYKLVVDTELNTNDLEMIFTLGNNGYLTSKYQMRSISISDIVEVNGKKYYVNAIGFKEIN